MKAQVANVLTKTAEHHAVMARAHQAAMEACEEGAPDHEFHKVALAAHAGMGEECVEACKVLAAASKAMMSNDGDAVIQLGVSAVAPDVTPGRTRAVYRAGQPQNHQATADEGELAKIFAIDEES